MLGPYYRFSILNSTGQTIAIAGLVVKGRRWKFNSSGALVFEGSEASIDSNAGTLASGAYFTGTIQDNTANLYTNGLFKLVVIAPASSSGTVTVFFQRSTDGGATAASWPDDGKGVKVRTFSFSAAGTQVDEIQL